MCAWELSPFSPRVRRRGLVGAGSGVLGVVHRLRCPTVLLLRAGGVGATPQSHSPLPQPSSPQKLVQLFCRAANSFFGPGGVPGLEAPGRSTTSRRALAGVACVVGRTAGCRRRPLPREAARADRRQAESGSAAGSLAARKFWDSS